TSSRRCRRRRSRSACPTSPLRRRSSRLGASRSATSGTPASATAPASPTLPATASCSTTATRRMSRADALAAYERLPIPDTSEEHWRFTDLAGFDPDAYGPDGGQALAMSAGAMVELDVSGLATVTADGIEIERAPDGITFAPLPEEYERL